jgi:predicted HTH transcriptional regulator
MSHLAAISETFDTELKAWLDPANPASAANIARACIALRNNNGGQLIFGIDNNTLQKSSAGIPADVKQTYHADVNPNGTQVFSD